MRLRRILTFLIVTFLSISLVACNNKPKETDVPKKVTDGTYTATVDGHNGPLKLKAVVEGEKIKTIQVVEHQETPNISDLAISSIPERIVAIQGLGVDAISGATVTSNAILAAAAEALKEAGYDVEALKQVKDTVKKEEDITLTADVIIIGAGGAGLAAAVSAHQEGASVIVIEKMPKVGGNTIMSGGALNAVDDGSETAKANKDSTELHFQQTYEGGDKKGDPELIRTYVENVWDGVEWLQSLGMKFEPGTFTVLGGLWPRAHKPSDPVGTGFFNTYQKYIDSNENIEVLLETKAEQLIVKDNRVTGVVATGKSGNKVTLNANNAVIIATGGFGANVQMRQEYNTIWKDLGENIKSTNHPGATGDGILMAKEVNAELVGMEYIQLLPMGDPKTGSLSGNIEKAVENRIFVNKEGNRFVDEGARRDVMTAALMEQTDSLLWVILDSHDYPTGDEVNNFNESVNTLIKEGRAFKGETLEELAAQIKVDPNNLVKAIEEYNKAVSGEIKDPFGRTLFKDPINQGPFYAAPRIPTVHHTMGGIKINKEAQVIDVNGNVIKGLYAAGEVTGGIHGANRLGGNALGDILVFGRIAGKNAASDKNVSEAK